ncbi:hypothetical protein ABK046_26510 [Streptomyces caeruleatus]
MPMGVLTDPDFALTALFRADVVGPDGPRGRLGHTGRASAASRAAGRRTNGVLTAHYRRLPREALRRGVGSSTSRLTWLEVTRMSDGARQTAVT